LLKVPVASARRISERFCFDRRTGACSASDGVAQVTSDRSLDRPGVLIERAVDLVQKSTRSCRWSGVNAHLRRTTV